MALTLNWEVGRLNRVGGLVRFAVVFFFKSPGRRDCRWGTLNTRGAAAAAVAAAAVAAAEHTQSAAYVLKVSVLC